MSGIQPMNAAARSLATSPASQLAAGIENAFEALQASKTAQTDSQAIANRCSGLLSLSLQQKATMPSSARIEAQELQAILSNSVMPCSFFGVSPPTRNGWAGGAANPLAHDKTWDKSAYNASHVNLQALREIESNGASFLRGDLLMPGSTPPDARMAFDQRAHAPSPAAPIQAPAAAPMIIDPLFTTTTVPCYHSSFQTSNLANNKSNEVGETKPFSCQTHYFLN